MRALPAVALAAVLVLAGCTGGGAGGLDGELTERWLSDTERDIQGNHHAVAAERVNGTAIVVAPISGHAPSDGEAADGHQHSHANGCALVGLRGGDGGVQWSQPVPEANCTIHAVADPAFGDVDDDGDLEVVAATTEETLETYDPVFGTVLSRTELDAYGFTRPLVGRFLPAGANPRSGNEVVVVDVRGNVVVTGPEGSVRWRHELDGNVQAEPHAVSVDDDPEQELVVALTTGTIVAVDPGEGVLWRHEVADASFTWTAAGELDSDGRTETVGASFDGQVVAVDDDGSRLWEREFGRLAAVHEIVESGEAAVYVTNKSGTVFALDEEGETVWRREVVEEDTQMTPPPVAGDLDGDGSQELVVAANTGEVTVLDAETGDPLASYSRDVPVWTHPTLADLDGDDDVEILVTYGDGRVARLAYEPPTSD
ncbi:PQQ-binding-like beta-propeller repeat protein [Halolamina sp.]|jgi:outer membrane protein assembly factor BamB|uniref:outer membrane protein assembly factor BamB family protein n=1 Tax=Halolamina sp. TaxID=1940283 RepID=UPI000223B91F|nr:FG-GAP repeat protein [halophilic archaeon DL31]